MTKRLQKGEIVKIISREDKDLEPIFGQEYVIRRILESDHESGYYSIIVNEKVWCIYGYEVESTGRFAEIEPMSNTTVKVSVSHDGIGKITQVIVDDKEQE